MEIMNKYYYLIMLVSVRTVLSSISLFLLYEKMGLKRSWIALIPGLSFKPLFDYTSVSFYLLALALIPHVGPYIFNTLICLVMIRLSLKVNKGFMFTLGLVLMPELFMFILAHLPNVDLHQRDKYSELKAEIERREHLGI